MTSIVANMIHGYRDLMDNKSGKEKILITKKTFFFFQFINSLITTNLLYFFTFYWRISKHWKLFSFKLNYTYIFLETKTKIKKKFSFLKQIFNFFKFNFYIVLLNWSFDFSMEISLTFLSFVEDFQFFTFFCL